MTSEGGKLYILGGYNGEPDAASLTPSLSPICHPFLSPSCSPPPTFSVAPSEQISAPLPVLFYFKKSQLCASERESAFG
eukprot:380631-Rhodomonas_salina.1